MPSLVERVSRRIEQQICPICVFRGAGGECHVPDSRGCAILRNVEGAINVVKDIHSDKMDPYIDRLRDVICSECPNEDSDGICALRAHADCPLDDYFGLLVEIIEEELAHKQAS